jgi:organic radical activating enzyme
MKIYKKFPIVTETACQLKWSHSTVFLTELTTASCHRVAHDKFDLETFDFHNTKEKLSDRGLMLEGKWPGRGCEHCKNIEDAGGTSDRMLHLDFHGYRAPPELDHTPLATQVTPRILEIYFSNVCNLKCVYCSPQFSSQINNENKKFGHFFKDGVHIPPFLHIPEEYPVATEKMFAWLDQHIHTLDQLLVLGGEPFIQKETQRLLEFLKNRSLPNLDLVIFSNMMIEHSQFIKQIDQLKKINNLNQITIIGSIDCWGPGAEYLRTGLDLELFDRNYTHLVEHTDFVLNINSSLSCLSIPEMPALVKKINRWSKTKSVNWTIMKTAGKSFLHPTIFGPALLDLGFNEAVDIFVTDSPEKISYLEYIKGIGSEIANTGPSIELQEKLKIYLNELDRRRGTDYANTFPEITKLL